MPLPIELLFDTKINYLKFDTKQIDIYQTSWNPVLCSLKYKWIYERERETEKKQVLNFFSLKWKMLEKLKQVNHPTSSSETSYWLHLVNKYEFLRHAGVLRFFPAWWLIWENMVKRKLKKALIVCCTMCPIWHKPKNVIFLMCDEFAKTCLWSGTTQQRKWYLFCQCQMAIEKKIDFVLWQQKKFQ